MQKAIMISRERLEQLANFRGAPVTRQEEQELAHIALASLEAVPSPELLCQFVMQNYANYQGAWLCGKSSEILSFLLLMAGHDCEKVACTINGVGHLYVRCGDLILDPSITQFGDYPEISRGKHPCTGMGYVENSTEPQKYRNASSDSEIIRAMKIAPASLEAEPVAWRYRHHNGLAPSNWKVVDSEDECNMAPNYQRQALYTAPPEPVSVPDYPQTLPCPVMLEPGLRFGKGVHTKIVLDALQRRAEYYAELDAMTPEQRTEHEAGMEEFAAMLQGGKS